MTGELTACALKANGLINRIRYFNRSGATDVLQSKAVKCFDENSGQREV